MFDSKARHDVASTQGGVHVNASAEKATAEFAEFARSFAGKVFVMVEVYADESGIHDPTGKQPGSQAACVAGYVAWAEDWVTFCGAWQTVLTKYGIPYFHFREYVDRKTHKKDTASPYHLWDDQRYDAFLRELASLPKPKTLFGVVSFVSVKDYNNDNVFSAECKRLIEHPYYFTLMGFYRTIVDRINQQFVFPGAKLTFFFDRQKQFQERSVALFNLVKDKFDSKNRMDTIAFTSKEEKLPLQAADLLAYPARQTAARLVTSGDQSLRWLPKELGFGSHVLVVGGDQSHLKRVNKVIQERRKREANDSRNEPT